MKFIHTADLHLDSPFRGLDEMSTSIWDRVHQSTFTAFERIIDAAIKYQVDFVLIVGDIYDRDHHSAEAEDFFVRQCQRLAEQQIPVYLSYGNHDYQAVTERLNSLPENVHVFGNQVETKTLTLTNDQTVAITGFSYGKRWLTEDQINDFPQKGKTDWQIGMLHGAISQNNPNQDHYAPFTLTELLQKKYDYWALGHIHKHQVLNEVPPIIYPGNPQGRHKNEDGHHGYYLVQSNANRLVAEFKPVAPIEWWKVDVYLDSPQTIDSLIEELARQVAPANVFKMIAFNVHLTAQTSSLVQRLLVNGTVLERLQEKLGERDAQWWPYQINLCEDVALPKMADLDQEYWNQAAPKVFNQTTVIDLADKLEKYTFIAEHLSDPLLIEELRDEAGRQLGRNDHDEN